MSGESSRRPAAGDRRTILIVEDEEHLRELVRAVLGPGYRYAEASDGIEALRQLRRLQPDLVVLDLMLPQTSGLEVLEEIRRNPRTRDTPVVVFTAWAHYEDQAQGAGADRFVSKPFEPAELQAIVRELLEPS